MKKKYIIVITIRLIKPQGCYPYKYCQSFTTWFEIPNSKTSLSQKKEFFFKEIYIYILRILFWFFSYSSTDKSSTINKNYELLKNDKTWALFMDALINWHFLCVVWGTPLKCLHFFATLAFYHLQPVSLPFFPWETDVTAEAAQVFDRITLFQIRDWWSGGWWWKESLNQIVSPLLFPCPPTWSSYVSPPTLWH